MTVFTSTTTLSSTTFSEFFRNAPSREKKRVYGEVLKKATERQQEQIARAEAIVSKSANVES